LALYFGAYTGVLISVHNTWVVVGAPAVRVQCAESLSQSTNFLVTLTNRLDEVLVWLLTLVQQTVGILQLKLHDNII